MLPAAHHFQLRPLLCSWDDWAELVIYLWWLQVNATPFAARRWSAWRQKVLLGVHRILKEANASIAPSAADIFQDDTLFAERMATLAND